MYIIIVVLIIIIILFKETEMCSVMDLYLPISFDVENTVITINVVGQH